MATVPNLSSSAANAQASKNRIPGLCDCSEPSEKSALILYPSLGTPLMLKEGQSKCSIFIVGEKGLRSPAGAGGNIPANAPNLHVFVDRHLRVYPIEKKDIETDTTVGTLFGDGKTCDVAKQHIDAWRVGSFDAGALIKDRHGRPFATVAPMAVKVYKDLAGGDIYEVELDLKAAPFKDINGKSFMSFAWMVKLNDEGKKLIPGATHAEPQDLMIARFLNDQADKDPYHFRNIHEFDLKKGAAHTATTLPPQKSDAADQLKSWHPVKYMPARALKLGHLSDVHVNVRHTALGQSPARVIEGEMSQEAAWNQPVGTKVCNAFDALRQLFRQMASGEDKADAVLLTGDLIDFNRNIDPAQVGGQIGGQWKAFNLLYNIYDKVRGPKLYPRGLDDMLVYSLVRAVYREHKLPVFMTSGNHEAYQVPYGISARVEEGSWGLKLGELEAQADPEKIKSVLGATANAVAQGIATAVDPPWTIPNLKKIIDGKPMGAPVARVTGADAKLAKHKRDLEGASAWVKGKANEGMSRDHNLTIYEACLAYGPTYGQVLTGFNFHGSQFDWFYALFTPLADCVIAYGAESDDASGAGAHQTIAALGWGVKENFTNVYDYDGKDEGVDRQGTGILPRAVESFSKDQLALVAQGQKYKLASKSSLTVASHFTIISFDEPEPYSNVGSKDKARASRTTFVPDNEAIGLRSARMDGAFNQVNVGTCERNQAIYLDQHVKVPGRRGTSPGVDWHLSGHSHRSGVYKIRWEFGRAAPRSAVPRFVRVVSAKDPGIHGPQRVEPNTETALIVSSCGGPIGYQNLDGELNAWTGRPPAGSLLDCATGTIKQVSTSRCRIEDQRAYNEKPRLAVALDYLWVMSGVPGKGDQMSPLSFVRNDRGQPDVVNVFLSEQAIKLNCIESIAIWLFEVQGVGPLAKKKWNRLTPTLIKSSLPTKSTLTFNGPELVMLNMAMNAGIVNQNAPRSRYEQGTKNCSIQHAFCEVTLRTPANTAAGENWGKDMVHEKDAWVFPLSISIDEETLSRTSYWSFSRGDEVPDWDFLAKNFPEKGYVPARESINPDGKR